MSTALAQKTGTCRASLALLAALFELSPALLQPAMADTVKKPAIDAIAAMSQAKAPNFRAPTTIMAKPQNT